jgi:hypothetical protein
MAEPRLSRELKLLVSQTAVSTGPDDDRVEWRIIGTVSDHIFV